MSTLPLSWLTDQQLQQRIDRFVDAAAEAEDRFDQAGDPDDYIEGERHWSAVRALMFEHARRLQRREAA